MQRIFIVPAILALLALPMLAQSGAGLPAPDDCPQCPCCNADPPCDPDAGWQRGPGAGPGSGHHGCGWRRDAGPGRRGAGRGPGFGRGPGGPGLGAGPGAGREVCLGTLQTTLAALPVGVPDGDEQAAVLYNREEEKLARDVYRALAETWSLPIFSRIASSEEHHMELMALLLERYGLEDPIVDDSAGVFTNPELALLYDELVSQGKGSLTAALEVGVAIEEMDLADLTASWDGTDEADARAVYERLLHATRHHMRAFTAQLG